MGKLSIERPYIDVKTTTNQDFLVEKRISFRDIGTINPYIEDNHSYVDTVSDLDGVWNDPIKGNSWKDDPNICHGFRQVIEKSGEFYLVTASIRSKRVSFIPFISDDQIEEIYDFFEKTNPSCKLFVICGPEKIFKGNKSREIIMRKIDQGHNVGVFGSSIRDKILTEKVYNNLNFRDKPLLTTFNTCHVFW